MRKKGSPINLTDVQRNNGIEVAFVQVSGVNLDTETLKGLDIRGIDWIGLPSSKTILLDQEMNRWDFNSLKQIVTRTKLAILEIEGWEIYTKPVLFKDYGDVVFCVVKDFQGNELGCFLLKDVPKGSTKALSPTRFCRTMLPIGSAGMNNKCRSDPCSKRIGNYKFIRSNWCYLWH
ncbi:MAG: hypothetical protein HF982_13410 [Desulfobacteraceae bacterium]|nr:hypothetical protein [Desulfobacteraceae bacterium]MBC2720557.1 hypothetical protein [Desulfobacteraceae bacterium]